jgi:phosphocarrier protein HPr
MFSNHRTHDGGQAISEFSIRIFSKIVRVFLPITEGIAMMKIKMMKKCVVKGSFIVGNDRGLHTRPSTEIVRCAANFKSQVRLVYQKNQVNAKSILGVLMLAATKGSKITVEAVGEDAEEAVSSLIDLADNNFNIDF